MPDFPKIYLLQIPNFIIQHPSASTMNPPQFPESEHLNCPRCDSANTKFCYYNNYNLSQPRHFCKNCRRYWTKGGTLRNIPIGGATRKTTKRSSNSNKRPANSSSPPPPPPPESSGIFNFSNNQTKVDGGSFNTRLQFGSFVDGLRANMGDGSQEDALIGSPATDVFRNNYLSVNNESGREESNGGGNGWPNLSIFTPGPNLR